MKTKRNKPPGRLARGPWEAVATALIGLSLFMLMQPWSLVVFGYSFTVLLLGVVGFLVAGKLPQDD